MALKLFSLLVAAATLGSAGIFKGAYAMGVGGANILSRDYYGESCPYVEDIVRQNMVSVLYIYPFLAASLLRLHFHDCFVLGCDASLLLDSQLGLLSEKEAVPNNNSLRGFEVIDQIKWAVEEACPGTVSCADILAIVARDAVFLRGGPNWQVELGRRDSLKASFGGANRFIPAPNFTLQMLVDNFEAHGLDIRDLVSLSGSHTIGRSRCLSFKSRLYGPLPPPPLVVGIGDGGGGEYDEAFTFYVPSYAFEESLRSICPADGSADNDFVPLDFTTPRRFDNQYFVNLLQGYGLLPSDDALLTEDRYSLGIREVAELVWAYATDQELFFRDFAESIVKMGGIGVLTGDEGEIRRHCRYLNI